MDSDDRYDVVVLGSINTDYSFSVDQFPSPGETLLSKSLTSTFGGKGANQATAASRMGSRVAMLGAVGDDERGQTLLAFLDDNAVSTAGILRSGSNPTGLATIFVNDVGENLVVVAQGANAALTPRDVRDAPSGAMFLAQLETPVDVIQSFFEVGRAYGAKCVLNAAPATAEGRKLFALSDILIVNEIELATYSGRPLDDSVPRDVADAAKSLLGHEGQTVIVTRGKSGVIAVRRGAQLIVAAHSAEALDTTGAGDCFCGALVASLATGHALAVAIDRASAAAAIAVGRVGAAAAAPAIAEVDAFLAQHDRVETRLRN